MKTPTVVLLLGALAGCVSEPPASTVIRTDSAGVEIVLSPATGMPAFVIDSVPELSLGGVDVSAPEEFGSIQGVAVASDGSIWVADRQGADVRVFGADGAHRVTVGGRGQGPGEFQVIRLAGTAGDSVAVLDDPSGRLSWYGLGGELLTETQVGREAETMPRVYGVRPDGRLAGALQRMVAASDLEPGDVLGGELEFVLWENPADPPVPFASGPTTKWVWNGSAQVPVPFTTNASLSVGAALILAAGPNPELRVFNDGSVRILRLDRAPELVGSSQRDAYSEFVRFAYRPEQVNAFLEVLEHPAVPEQAPAHARVLESSALLPIPWVKLHEEGMGIGARS